MSRIALALCILMLCIGQKSFAQIQVTSLMLIDTSAIELFINVENRVRISGLKSGDKVMFADRPAARIDSNIYVLSPIYPAEKVLAVRNKTGVVYTKEFSVVKIPDPVVRLDTIQGTYATVAAILANPRLILETGNLKNWISLIAFDLAIQTKAGYEETPAMLGDRLSVYQIDLVRRLIPGDKLLFENIKATCPNCGVRTLKPFTIIIQ